MARGSFGKNMKVDMKKFFAQEAKEPEHKSVKATLLKKAGIKAKGNDNG